MKVIVITLGGIGNQLFQLSALAEFSTQADLIIDSNLFHDSSNLIDLGLYDFIVASNLVHQEFHGNTWIIRRFAGVLLRLSAWKYRRKIHGLIFNLLFKITQALMVNRYDSKVSLFVPGNVGFETYSKSDGTECVVLLGYFQSFKFHKSRDSIRDRFFNNQKYLYLQSIRSRELGLFPKPLIVHVRRGDYLKNPRFGVLSKAYYLENIPRVFEESGAASIWLFANDFKDILDYVPKQLRARTRVMNDIRLSDLENLFLMTSGHAYLIANSTFSWWAAYLSNANPTSIIYSFPLVRRFSRP
jgi:hypothetical protein